MAGAGKTAAVSAAVARLPDRVAWLGVEASEADPDRFLAYLAAAANLRGPLLWPAVILHAAVALLLARPVGARTAS